MQALIKLPQVLVGAAVQLGVAYQSGVRAARNRQRTADLEAAEDAQTARQNAAADLDLRDDIIDELRNADRLRD